MEKSIEQKPVATQQDNKGSDNVDLSLKGRFARYDSPFLKLMIPLLSTRYVWVAYEDINPKNLLGKPPPGGNAAEKLAEALKKPTFKKYLQRNIAALGMGATVLGLTAFYSKRTYDDIKTMYADAVGYELDKKPADVNWHDIFVKSHNSALVVTRDAFLKRTAMRSAAGAAFWVPWHKVRDLPEVAPPKYDANVNAGVGAMGTYLSLDGFMRKQSFFEAEQTLIDTTINHVDNNTHEIINFKHIESLLLLHRRHMKKDYKWPALSSPEGAHETMLASRISDLMNQTYNNTKRSEQADFNIGKFNYLIGFGLLDSFPTSLAYVELANKSTDMKEVKAAAAAIKNGQEAQTVFKSFGIDMNEIAKKTESPSLNMPESAITKFVDSIQPIKSRIPSEARTHADFAALNSSGKDWSLASNN